MPCRSPDVLANSSLRRESLERKIGSGERQEGPRPNFFCGYSIADSGLESAVRQQI